MRKKSAVIMMAVVLVAVVSGSAVSLQAATKAERMTAKKRSWLRKGFAAQMNNRQQIRAMKKRIKNMSPEEIDRLVEQVQTHLAQVRQQQYRQAVDYRNYLRRQQQAYMYNTRRRNVGFAPFITWLPKGVSMSAGAVVSPDRRYVRINAQPFFSTIGSVHTFNMKTGRYKRIR